VRAASSGQQPYQIMDPKADSFRMGRGWSGNWKGNKLKGSQSIFIGGITAIYQRK